DPAKEPPLTSSQSGETHRSKAQLPLLAGATITSRRAVRNKIQSTVVLNQQNEGTASLAAVKESHQQVMSQRPNHTSHHRRRKTLTTASLPHPSTDTEDQ
ncbi:predicted protein, partial [Arabidopsis lyrata subsp. lyrata]